jgi:hypothetical protein
MDEKNCLLHKHSYRGTREGEAVLWIRDILVRFRMRIRILESVPLSDPNADPEGPKTYIRILRIRIRNTVKSHKEVTTQ